MRPSLRGGRRVGAGRAAPGVRMQAGGRLAHPETFSPAPAPPARPAPPLARTVSRGAAGPTSRSAAPSAGAAAPPRRPFALIPSLFPCPSKEGALVLRPRLASSFPHSCPLARVSPRRRCLFASCQCGPPPLGSSPLRPGRDSWRPRGPKSVSRSPQTCTWVPCGRKNGREFGLLLLKKDSSAKKLLVLLFHFIFL